MNLSLKNKEFSKDGVFGELSDEAGNFVAYTLQHAYPDGTGWTPKLPNGTYTCVRGQHRLDHMTSDFTTFEITGVPGHSGILFHVGNYNKDSDGCVLLGMMWLADNIPPMIAGSKVAFANLMNLQADVDTFTLTVSNS